MENDSQNSTSTAGQASSGTRRTLQFSWRLGLITIVWLLVMVSDSQAIETTTVGIEGLFYLRHQGAALEAKPTGDRSAIKLRINNQVDDQGVTQYELRYIGSRPGKYDLTKFLQRVDGRAIADLSPAMVQVDSVLPVDHDGELRELSAIDRLEFWNYRHGMFLAISIWTAAGAWMLIRRIRRPLPAVPRGEQELSLCDQLRPLVEAAAAGSLSATGQARMEMLLIGYWRDELELRDSTSAHALEQMREHPDAGELLAALERWLHRPPGQETVNVAEILSRYQSDSPNHVPARAPKLSSAADDPSLQEASP